MGEAGGGGGGFGDVTNLTRLIGYVCYSVQGEIINQ